MLDTQILSILKSVWVYSAKIVTYYRPVFNIVALVWSIMENFAPQVRNTRYLLQPEADDLIMEIMYSALPFASSVPSMSDADYQHLCRLLSGDRDWAYSPNALPTDIASNVVDVNKSIEGALGI